MLSYSGYLLVAALGIVVSFRGGMFNLGGEGQIFVGAFAGTVAAIGAQGMPGFVVLILLLTVSTATGASMAAVPGLLRHRFRAPELITSYLLSAAFIPLTEYLITGPAKDPARNLLATRTIESAAWLPRLFAPSELNLAAPIALLLALLTLAFLYRTVRGYEIRLYGQSEEFALYSGVHEGAMTTGTMAISGALHGLAGGLMIAGTYHAAISGFTGGIGWNAIAVALVGRLHPLGAIAAALLFGYLDAGSKAAMLHTDFTFELGTVIQGTVLLLVTATIVLRRRR
jgi:simple sugar transport system permease protein